MKMKRLFLLSAQALWLVLGGCTTTEYTLYLQDVQVKGPISQPPVPITDRNQEKPLRITPHFSFNPTSGRTLGGQIDGHSPVDANGRYQVDAVIDTFYHTISFHERPGANNFSFSGQNLRWEQPSSSMGVDVDYTFSKHWALSLGSSYSSVDGDGLWGYRVGLGIFSETEHSAIRFDGGVRWQELRYDVSTVVVARTVSPSSTTEEVGFFHDRGKSTPADFYAAITFNTRNPDWAANIFLQAALSKQSLAKFKPTLVDPAVFFPFPVPLQPDVIVHDQRAEFSSTFVVLTPGIYLNFDQSTRLLIGTRINLQTEIRDSTPETFVLPFMQLDLVF